MCAPTEERPVAQRDVCAVTRVSPAVNCDHCVTVIPKSHSLIFAGAAADREWP
jgi:hypothetical protein